MSDVPEAICIPSFPVELTDNIIDQLYTDKATLSSCTLVSRSWLSRSRHHLFAKVQVLGFKTHFPPFIEFLTQADGGPRINPPACILIKHLCLDGRESEFGSLGPLTTTMLKTLLSNLPNLLDLDICGVELKWIAPDTDPHDGQPDPVNLDSLTLDAFTPSSFTDPSDLVLSLCFFSSINLLRISSPVYATDIPEDPRVVAAHPSLVTTQPYFPSRLEISSIEVCDASVNRHYDEDTLSTMLLTAYNLPACTALTNLTLRMSTMSPLPLLDRRYRQHQSHNDMIFRAASVLAIYAPATLQTVTLDILFDGDYMHLNRLYSMVEDMAQGLLWLQSVITKHKGPKLCIRWNGLQESVRHEEEREEVEDELCPLRETEGLKLILPFHKFLSAFVNNE
ncbi:hypothetical protein PHLCEN_2v13309 [Hermanssonia centrifuga]|uniref:F-box domain-containing protein n=1 Tax=Hermanssonia centrifuga TaxID=98765 RepID=A0A2R6NES1_9APHY|nr:hypothetical protein PHLCEN_2v13309 [Hermanssonia centrifuga]